MSSYEFTGKSVKEAIAKACAELNVREELLDIEVVEESTRGFLGIVGHRDARIKVAVRQVTSPVEPREEVSQLSAPAEETKLDEPQTTGAEEKAEQPETIEELEKEEDLHPLPPATVIDEELVNRTRAILQGILQRIPVEADVTSSIVEGAIHLDIRGDGSGLLIGKRGQTLDALQFILSKCINKNVPSSRRIEIVVDTENYRQRKRESLRETALKMSLKAKKTLKPVSFNPMPPSERRIVHLILAEDSEVYTKSYGEGPMRRIIVYPRKVGVNKRRRR